MRNILVPNATLLNPGIQVVPALNTWNRLEPLPQSTDLVPALQAAIADPLWLIARQWQFLELAGEDAGTPIEARVDAEAAPVTRYLAGALGAEAAARASAYASATLPLEVTVEREPARLLHARLGADAGMYFLRLLNVPGLAKFRDDYTAEYPLDVPTSPGDAGADTTGAAWAAVWRGRALDGRKLAAALAPLRDANGRLTGVPAGPKVPPGQQKKLIDVLQKWVEWFDDALVETGAADAWNPSRQEYAFAAAARVTGGEITLAADEYADGDLDWYAVDAVPQSLGASAPARHWTKSESKGVCPSSNGSFVLAWQECPSAARDAS